MRRPFPFAFKGRVQFDIFYDARSIERNDDLLNDDLPSLINNGADGEAICSGFQVTIREIKDTTHFSSIFLIVFIVESFKF